MNRNDLDHITIWEYTDDDTTRWAWSSDKHDGGDYKHDGGDCDTLYEAIKQVAHAYGWTLY